MSMYDVIFVEKSQQGIVMFAGRSIAEHVHLFPTRADLIAMMQVAPDLAKESGPGK